MRFILLFGTIMFWAIAWYISYDLFSGGFVQLPLAVLTGVFFLLGLLCFIVLLRLKVLLEKESIIRDKSKNQTCFWKFVWTGLVIVLVLAISYWGIDQMINPVRIEANQVIEIRTTIKDSPEYSSGRNGGSGRMNFRINEFPEIDFNLPFADYFNRKTSIENDLKETDSVFCAIPNEDFHSYIRQDKALSFSQKHLGHNTIAVKSIRSENQSYLTIDEHNELSRKSSRFAILFIVLIMTLGLLTIISLWKERVYSYLDKNNFQKTKLMLAKILEKKSKK